MDKLLLVHRRCLVGNVDSNDGKFCLSLDGWLLGQIL
jgi:hypothetical protein